jgi:hypothetical protein
VDFQHAREEYGRLKARLDQKQIQPVDFEKAVYRMRVRDQNGADWQIGPATGRWLRFDGERWVEDSPEATGATAVPEHGRLPGWLTISIGMSLILVTCAVGAALVLNRPEPGSKTARDLTSSGTSASMQPGTPGDGSASLQSSSTAGLAPDAPENGTAAPGNEPGKPASGTEQTELAGTAPAESVATADFAPATARSWSSISHSIFDEEANVLDEWKYIFEISDEHTFTNFNGFPGLHLVMSANSVDITSQNEDQINALSSMEMEEVFAFPSNSNSGNVELVCRYHDLNNYYALIVKRTVWRLITRVNNVDTELAQGGTPDHFQNRGAWGRVRLRCEGDEIKAWFDGEEIVTKSAANFQTGAWGVLLMQDENDSAYDLYYQRHSVWQLQNGSTPGLYGAGDGGTIWASLESGLVETGTVETLLVNFENSASTGVDLEVSQIYLERADGHRFAASSGAEDSTRFPLTLDPGQREETIAFEGVTAQDAQTGLNLVIDLTRDNLGRMRFKIPSGE